MVALLATWPLIAAETIESRGYETTKKILSWKNIPELLYIADDHMTRGCITAILEMGKRIPEDIQIIAQTNKGNQPIFKHKLTRIEHDPKADGQGILNLVKSVLNKQNDSEHIEENITLQFIVGGSTR